MGCLAFHQHLHTRSPEWASRPHRIVEIEGLEPSPPHDGLLERIHDAAVQAPLPADQSGRLSDIQELEEEAVRAKFVEMTEFQLKDFDEVMEGVG